jgi:hypothetical protein
MTKRKYYINFNIKKFNIIDNTINIIRLIDEKIIELKHQIYKTNIIIKIYKISDNDFDYECITNILCSKNIIEEYLNFIFTQIQNLIKFNYIEFGFDWYIDYKLHNINDNKLINM